MVSRRVAIRAILRSSAGLGLAAGVAALAGCRERELPVIPSNKSKDDLQKEIENPLGIPTKAGGAPGRGR